MSLMRDLGVGELPSLRTCGMSELWNYRISAHAGTRRLIITEQIMVRRLQVAFGTTGLPPYGEAQSRDLQDA